MMAKWDIDIFFQLFVRLLPDILFKAMSFAYFISSFISHTRKLVDFAYELVHIWFHGLSW